MKKYKEKSRFTLDRFLTRFGLGMRAKLIIIFLLTQVIPLILLTLIAWRQFIALGNTLDTIAVDDASAALNDSAVENIERMTTDTAGSVAAFLYERDDDILYLSGIKPSEQDYNLFIQNKTGRVIETGQWELAQDGASWVLASSSEETEAKASGDVSTNSENNDMDGFNYRQPDGFDYTNIPLYDEITFIDLEGNELIKVVSEDSTKTNYPLSTEKKNVADKANTYIKAETYFDSLKKLKPGEIYVSDVIGAYVGSNYIGMYTPGNVDKAAQDRGYDIEYDPETQAYSGLENPNGQRFEGIVRWATPVTDESGEIIGYVTFALNHDHIMEFVDHITPMNERYTELPSAYEGNYAFIWDYKCRSICHPRHHSIVGYDPETGDPQIPWLETSIYEAWQSSGVEKWFDYARSVNLPLFDEQSRSKKPASMLTQQGYVGLDGRYLNNAPQCTGWMDLTQDGGSGSFYILWSGLYKLTTAAAIPYYTGQYAPSDANEYSLRGFGIVTIGAGLEDFARPAVEMEEKLTEAVDNSLTRTTLTLMVILAVLVILVVSIAIQLASSLTGSITGLIKGISRFKAGERRFRFNSEDKDEFGTLADSFDEMADSIVDSVKSPMCITDMKHNIIYMNDAGLELRKVTFDMINGRPYSENSVYPAYSKYCPIQSLDEGHEAEIYYAEDRNIYIKGTADFLLNEQGERIGYIIITMDVTEMVREQKRIEEQRTLLDEIFSASPDLIWYTDSNGRYLTVNPRFAAIPGLSTDDFVGKIPKDILPPTLAESFIKSDLEAIAAKRPLYTEERIMFADGHEETLESARTPVFGTDGELVGLLGFARNVTRRVTVENELRSTQIKMEQAVMDANRANEYKGEFLARMSHEIRTPMNAILGIASILHKKLVETTNKSGDINDALSYVQQIETSSQHLLGLLNDVLDITKIEAGKIELTEETVEIYKLFNTVVGIIKPRCDEKKIKFKTTFDSFDPSTFLCDSLRLRQVLINLLGNAVKFTPMYGMIEFRVLKKGQENDRTLIEFSVIDTGIGVSEDRITSIFQPFEQAGSNISRQYGGTGLGLSISSRIVELFGGEIKVTSKLEEGSNFNFAIWLTEAESNLPDRNAIADATGKFTGKCALIVDDVAVNRMIVTSMLDGTGIELDEAADGMEAVDKFKQSEPGTYDIILMDVQMPNMDGNEATAEIRALDRADAGTVPIIALTANAFKDDVNKALKYGMNGHIAKPVEIDTLIETLFRYLI